MKISVVVPTHRVSPGALARIMEVSALDAQSFEVVVRDNSGDRGKVSALHALASESVKVHAVAPCGAFENAIEAFRLATGEFLFFLADDDWISVRTLRRVHGLAAAALQDRSVASIHADTFIETSAGAGIVHYDGLDDVDPVKRLSGYLKANAPNVFYYSCVRRTAAQLCFEILDSMPCKFSFHDQLVSLLYLALGRSLRADGVAYFYDLGEWETLEKTVGKDRSMYQAAGVPVEIDRLHFLLGAMEGALLLKSRTMMQVTQRDPSSLINLWFGTMYQRFKHLSRPDDYPRSKLNSATEALARRWSERDDVNLDELLLDVTDLIDASNPDLARRYFEFWSTV